MTLLPLTIEALRAEAAAFAREESVHAEASLYGIKDSKAVDTYLEQKFRTYVAARYAIGAGDAAAGVAFPAVDADIKVISERQPQSLCLFKSARQKIFGLGYSLLLFVYDKIDDKARRTSQITIRHTLFMDASATGDFTMTHRLREMISDGGSRDDIVAFLMDRNLPVDEIEASAIADEVLRETPAQGYITISTALQWRLQYSHAIRIAGSVPGVVRIEK